MNLPEPGYAERAAQLRESPIRALLALSGRSDVVSLAGGLPDADSFPAQAVREAASRVLSERAHDALQYGPSEGIAPLRAWVAEHLRGQGIAVAPEQVLITSGSQQGLDLLGKVLLDAGSRVLVERPTYLGALQAFALYQPQFVGLDGDADGPLPEALAAALPARLAYLQPRFSNPGGTSVAPQRAQQLAGQLVASACWLVEDDPYGELWFDAPPACGLLARGVAHGVHLGTFSKVLAPGLRLGWVAAPPELATRLALARQAGDLQSPSLNQWVLLELLRDGTVARALPGLRALYRARRDAMLAALRAQMPPGVVWSEPAGGFFVWLTLPRQLDAAALLPRALERGVAYVPGAGFDVAGSRCDTLRLSFSSADAAAIGEAIARLGALFTEALSDASAVHPA